MEKVDNFQGPANLFNELPIFVSEEEDKVHTQEEEN